MRLQTMQAENVIRGSCSFFVCKCCRTKRGWEHQPWCEYFSLTEPGCDDCHYCDRRGSGCVHPAKRIERRDNGFEEDQHSL